MNNVQGLEQQLDDSKELMQRRDKAVKLFQNKDFKDIIMTEFCGVECARYAQSSADPALSPEQRQDALNMAQAAGHLKRYLSLQIVMGNNAEDTLEELSDQLELTRQESNE